MGHQLDIYDAIEAREAAIDLVHPGASDGWMNAAVHIVLRLCKSQSHFTTDDIVCAESAPEPRIWGAVMRECAKLKYCEPTDRTRPSARKSNHARPVRVWKSLIFE